MDITRAANVFGALALSLADDIINAASSLAPEAGPAASALVLLGHDPGSSIRTLAAGVGLSHAGAVRLVDRLVADGLVERRSHAIDGRTRSLHLTPKGLQVCAAVVQARDNVLMRGLASLSRQEVEVLGQLSERVLRAGLRDADHGARTCRLCHHERCRKCPVDAELKARGLAASP
jgi:DNA-binding MarR family transcriptional regulator